ncbi:hypothetical protein [Parasitella parasitica]|uniref:Uncharacterized protein n=1 Tax=Parasitella parasitica TaxID=35722 RepID=A0A0B7MWC5_9FUNG|nr:hypothetical protein [Parasitella parasitica]
MKKTLNRSSFSLRPWVNENHNCPLCKKSCSFRQIISPLYLSSEDEHDSGITAAETSEHTQTLQLRVLSLMREKETATQNFNTAKQALQDEREKSQVMASDLRGATKAVRHMKQIRRVAELDDLMNSPTAKAFFQNLESFSKEDLLIQNRAMQSRLKKAHTERDDAVRKSSILERENLHLQKKIERLKEKLQTAETGHPAQSKPKRTNNIIILDESEKDNSEDDNITLDDDDSDSPVLLTEESSTSNNASDNHSSYNRNNSNRQSLKSTGSPSRAPIFVNQCDSQFLGYKKRPYADNLIPLLANESTIVQGVDLVIVMTATGIATTAGSLFAASNRFEANIVSSAVMSNQDGKQRKKSGMPAECSRV